MFLERILALCKGQKISKNKLLTDLNLNKSAFVNWGNRGNIPSGDIVAKIADYFHVSTDYLLGRTDDPQPVGEEKEPPAQGGGLTEPEKKVLESFRAIPEEDQEMVTQMIEAALKSRGLR